MEDRGVFSLCFDDVTSAFEDELPSTDRSPIKSSSGVRHGDWSFGISSGMDNENRGG